MDELGRKIGTRDGIPTRSTIEATLDRIVRKHRFTIAVIFPAVGAIVLVASAQGWLPSALAFNPLLILLGVIVMRSPVISALLPLVDRRVLLGIGALVVYTYGIEYVGVHTGWPYGQFTYGVSLGPMVGGIPLALPFLFIPFVLNAYLLCVVIGGDSHHRRYLRFIAIVASVVAMDLVLDPAAVALGFWSYAGDAVYYDVPISNYAGWVLSATVAVLAVEFAFDDSEVQERIETTPYVLDDLVSFVIIWGLINGWFYHWIPVVVAGVFALAIIVGLLRRHGLPELGGGDGVHVG